MARRSRMFRDSTSCTSMSAVSIPTPITRANKRAKTVEQARCGLREDLAARQLGPARVGSEVPNVARTVLFVRRARVSDIEIFLVGREGDAVRTNHIGDNRGDRARFG